MEKRTSTTPPEDVVAALRAVGRRKSAHASVRMRKNGTGIITVNRKDFSAYFTTRDSRASVRSPLEAVGQTDKVDIDVRVEGGGVHSQADAVRLGIARALCLLNPTFRRALRKVGCITRDARVKERKKPGLKRARRAPQWSKR